MIILLQWLFLGHAHKWEVYYVKHYNDTSYGVHPGIQSSIVTSMCTECRKFKMQTLYGAGHIEPVKIG